MLQSDSPRETVHIDVVTSFRTGNFASNMPKMILDSDLLSMRGVYDCSRSHPQGEPFFVERIGKNGKFGRSFDGNLGEKSLKLLLGLCLRAIVSVGKATNRKFPAKTSEKS